jgi:histidinol-phosphate aminotransferase
MKKLNRREALRMGGLLGVGTFTNIETLWSSNLNDAISQNKKFIFESNTISEYAPPSLPKLSSLKARLHWNENPFGPSKMALDSFVKSAEKGNYYSWDTLKDFIQKVATKENVTSNQIMTGPGSSDLLEKTAIALFEGKKGNIVTADPCYMSLVNVASSLGASWKAVKLNDQFEHDLDRMHTAIDSNTRLVYITNPNNPTATVTHSERLLEFCADVSEKVPVFIDEAYLELTEGGLTNSMAKLISQGKDIIVTRTFSKIHGMAGMRLGYMLAQAERINQINQITRGGMGISGPTIQAAMSSLDDVDFLNTCKAKITENRDFTVQNLKARGFEPLPATANFLIFELPKEIDPNSFLSEIYSRKVSVKVFQFWDKNWCRVSIGTKNGMETFFKAFDEITA